MKTVTALAAAVSLFCLLSPGTGAEAKSQMRIKDHHNDHWKISCNTARHMVRERGYMSVKDKSCIATVYSFRAMRKGRHLIVYVDSRTGSLWAQ